MQKDTLEKVKNTYLSLRALALSTLVTTAANSHVQIASKHYNHLLRFCIPPYTFVVLPSSLFFWSNIEKDIDIFSPRSFTTLHLFAYF